MQTGFSFFCRFAFFVEAHAKAARKHCANALGISWLFCAIGTVRRSFSSRPLQNKWPSLMKIDFAGMIMPCFC